MVQEPREEGAPSAKLRYFGVVRPTSSVTGLPSRSGVFETEPESRGSFLVGERPAGMGFLWTRPSFSGPLRTTAIAAVCIARRVCLAISLVRKELFEPSGSSQKASALAG